MALHSFRLRRALSLSSAIFSHHKPLSSLPPLSRPAVLSSTSIVPQSRSIERSLFDDFDLPFHARFFSSSRGRGNYSSNLDEDKIGPDTILFEGCDYKHWLITMDFRDKPNITPEEMVGTYVETAAKVFGSVEEAKKKIYACSTTTYQGFQVEISEEDSEKFRGLPGVVFILPDSYIDPVNKEYGGDKYINGTIIPSRRPVYGSHQGRYNDRNRNNQQNQPRNYGPQQNAPPQRSYSQPGTGERRDYMPMNNVPVREGIFNSDGRNAMPSYQPNNRPGEPGNYQPQGQREFQGHNRNYGPPQGVNRGQGVSENYGQGHGQGVSGNYGQGHGQGQSGYYGQGHVQGVGGNYGQGDGQGVSGNYGQGYGESRGQGMGPGYGQGYSQHGGEQRFSQEGSRNNVHGEQENYTSTGNTTI